ncbi:hypothetical protein A2755_00570 [Candidatus Wolfebacteria bacterium RIFCSPHIGHO2_01_FULL_48_22]|uniref:Peptidase S11 D-alanyl-D-alanine carboxypeptidase A N-terminal domain-containing protein n=2 Tax=Candidatus Wolfeibacteriota TaxID=1752735 RepID=A0A1F8DT90_9BACT|nr:MAG: hypothetical protein A2755_00570 [Candidatus Wolfebacteria bacterium RIFCSPHIGHO2_01_FULL_48_22]OGM92657.1 MAG: hypothetical protein A2935_04035 [Candidatus Wolfebacteria bacterium RIFCSPLOWO2_01_FULL_47_17b]
MRYQTLLLIVVILVSVTAVKGFGVFANEERTEVLSVAELTQAMPASEKVPSRSPVLLESSLPAQAGYAEEQVRVRPVHSSDDSCSAVRASIAYVRDMESGALVYNRNISQRWPIASITKLMSAVIAIEQFDTKEPVTITAAHVERTEGFSTFSPGTTLTANDMVRALLIASSNDAAFALADHMGEEEFIGRMQAKAQELGMNQTSFYEPSGLSFLNQSTASDLYLLMRYIHHTHPYLLDSTRQKTVTVWDSGQGKQKTVANINQFAGRSDFLGGKTGFIDQSGGNLVAMFKADGKQLFAAVLGSADRFGEIETLLNCMSE